VSSFKTALVGGTFLAALAAAGSANATLVTFEDQTAGSSNFTGGSTQTLTYESGSTTATFTGGVLLHHEGGTVADLTNVYATHGVAPFTNPLVVTFSAPVQNFEIEVLNATPGNYEVSDNAGHTDFFTLTLGGSQTVDFASAGTIVDITSLNGGTWDFAIDNINFDAATNVPEPAGWTLMLVGIGGLLAAARRSPRKPEFGV
jgi:hypothetical protein